MAAATTTVGNFGRSTSYGTVAVIPCTIVASATTYATASGGLPIDLTVPLTVAAPPEQPYLNPADVVAAIPMGPSTPGGYRADAVTVGTATYNTSPGYPWAGGQGTQARPVQTLATCPATVRLSGKAGGASGEFADGACSETFSFMLIVARGGTNV